MEDNNLDHLLNSMKDLNEALESLVKKLSEDINYADEIMSYHKAQQPKLDDQLSAINLFEEIQNRQN
ncbi:hypothetical protein [Persicobacter psychrovividus]|uniref:DUF904 domain-containing protein n=1 Tax=Persicobacter psychrovividus TaxID=387638 RepID=A0ABM7VEN9_9BACT|nr:hypothetical protein PEPS_16770 [Persicobacter psychrovividus]